MAPKTASSKTNHDATVQMVSPHSLIWRSELTTAEEKRFAKATADVAEARWDDNPAVVRSYIDDLADNGDASSIKSLVQALLTGAAFTQRLACRALVRTGKSGLAALAQHIIRQDGSLNHEVFQTLRLNLEACAPVLLDALEGKFKFPVTNGHKEAYFKILSHFPNSRVSSFLCGHLVSLDPNLRRAAADALVRQGKAAEKPLLVLLNESPAGHRCQKYCIYLLGHLRSQAAAKDIIRMFCKEKSAYLVCLEAWALGEIGAREAVAPLVFVLEERRHSWLVLRSIITALGRLGSENSVEAIIPFLEDRSLRESAIVALGRIGSGDALEALRPFMHSGINYLRYLTVSALAHMGDKRALRAMLDGLSDPDDMVRKHAEKALANIYTDEEINEIYARLEERYHRSTMPAWQRLLNIRKDAAPELYQAPPSYETSHDELPYSEFGFGSENAFEETPQDQPPEPTNALDAWAQDIQQEDEFAWQPPQDESSDDAERPLDRSWDYRNL